MTKQAANADCVNSLTIHHITPACPILAKEKYIKRHDTVYSVLHFNICKEMGVKLDTTLV
jgi:hypothetical protein